MSDPTPAELPSDVHPELGAVVAKYLDRGYSLRFATRDTATLTRPIGRRTGFLLTAIVLAGIATGSGGATQGDATDTVELYMNDQGHVLRRISLWQRITNLWKRGR